MAPLTLLFFCLCTAMAAEFGQSLVIIPHKSKLLENLSGVVTQTEVLVRPLHSSVFHSGTVFL